MRQAKTTFLFVFSVFIFASLDAQKPNENVLRKLTNEISDTTTAAINVYVFFSPECPICINMIMPLKELIETYGSKNVLCKMIYSGTYYSDDKIKTFHKEYSVKADAYKDDNFAFAKQLKAKVTPTAIVFNKAGEKIYEGKINNQYEGVGKRRPVVTDEYLKNAIVAALNRQKPTVRYTKAIGCFMTYNK